MIRSQSAGSESTNGPDLSQPALLTRTSIRPNRWCTCSTMASTDSREVTSARIPRALPMRCGGLRGGGLVDVGDHDGGALGGQLLRDAPADTLPGPGDDRDLAVQSGHVRCSHAQWQIDVRGEVGRALLGERRGALLPLGRVGEQIQRGHRQVGQAGLVVGVGVERLLEEAQRRRALRRDLRGPRLGLGQQPVRGDDRVHQSPALGGRRVVEPAEVPHLAGPLLADDAGQVRRAETRVERADPRAGLSEPRGVRRDRQVAQHVQHVPAADREAVDRGDHRLGDVPDQLVQIADLEHARSRSARSRRSRPAASRRRRCRTPCRRRR